MLNRQRLILALLARAGGSASATQLVKLAFLLREETEVGRDRTFYGFVPYRYGPFSFALYRELAGLERDGYVEKTERRISLTPGGADLWQPQIDRLGAWQLEAAAAVARRYGRLARAQLVRRVYERYPWYARRSELADLVPAELPQPPRLPIAVYTVGYGGRSVDEFFDGLLRAGVGGVLDVRANPISRKYGFAKSSMRRIAEDLGLAYHHLPGLGITSDRRAELGDFASYQRLLDSYERQMLPHRGTDVRRAIELLGERPSALLCVESDVRCCHRSRLAAHLAAESGLEVVHL